MSLEQLPREPLRTRIGDQERALVCDRLSEHYAAGRLRADELDERLAAAVAASTRGDLEALLADLPAPAAETPPPVLRPLAPRPWNALDVLAVLAVVGGLAVALLVSVGLMVGASAALLVAGVAGGTVAAAGGGGLVHLMHRGWREAVLREADRTRRADRPGGAQRPRID